MKSKVLVVVFVVAATAVWAFSSNPPDGYTGAPGEGLCTSCHGGAAPNSGPGRLVIEGFPPQYTPGAVYKVTINLSDPDARSWGFEATVKGNPPGTLRIVDMDRTQLSTARTGAQYVKQTSRGLSVGASGSTSWSFEWVAPDGGSGPVVLYAVGNVANGNGSASGDRIYTANATSEPVSAVRKSGDLDGDGRISISDVIIALRIAIGIRQATPDEISAADVAPKPGIGGRTYGDGSVNVGDVIRILRRAVGLEPDPWP